MTRQEIAIEVARAKAVLEQYCGDGYWRLYNTSEEPELEDCKKGLAVGDVLYKWDEDDEIEEFRVDYLDHRGVGYTISHHGAFPVLRYIGHACHTSIVSCLQSLRYSDIAYLRRLAAAHSKLSDLMQKHEVVWPRKKENHEN